VAGRKRTRHKRICGAKNRKGLPCQCKLLLKKGQPDPNGRCKFHGGMSTGAKTLKPGPKTPAGIARSYAARDAGRARRWARVRNARSNANVTLAALQASQD
jgi:hypothetical protein